MINWFNTLRIDNTISVPVIVSILVFVVGGLVASIKNMVIGMVHRTILRKAFKNIINEIARTSNVKSKRIMEFYPTLEITHDANWHFKFNSISHLSIAFNQDYTTVYNSFKVKFFFRCKSKLQTKCYNKVWSILANLTFIEERIKVDFDQFFQKFNQHEIGYTSYLEKLRQQNDRLMAEIKIVPLGQERLLEYLKKRDTIFYEWQQMDNRTTLSNTHDHLIKTLRVLNREYHDIKYSVEQNDCLLPAAHEYGQMLETLKVYKSSFQNHYYNYLNSYKILKYCLKKI